MTDNTPEESEAAELVRPYVITRGRELPAEDKFSLITRAPVPRARLVDQQLLQEVLDGLQARFG